MKKTTGIMFVVLLIAMDQLTKAWVENSLPFHEAVPVLPFLAWYRTWNEGIAFSFLSFLNDWALVGITILIIIFVLWLWKNADRNRWISQTGFALVIGGAIGNLVDRLFLGHVVDFILFHIGDWSFAVFNLADAFISTGAGLIILDEILHEINARRLARTNPDQE